MLSAYNTANFGTDRTGTALGAGVRGSSTRTVAAFDLFAYDGRLFALGVLDNSTTRPAFLLPP